jgi:hypothetical protein
MKLLDDVKCLMTSCQKCQMEKGLSPGQVALCEMKRKGGLLALWVPLILLFVIGALMVYWNFRLIVH